MHTSWQWSVAPFQGFASPCGYLQMPLSSHREGTSTGACFVLFGFFFFFFGFVLFYFFKAKEPKPRAVGCKTALGKTGRGSHKTRVLFSCFVHPVYFPLKQSLLGTKVCRELGRAAVVPWRPGPSNQVVYQTLPGTGKQQQHRQALHLFFKKQPPKPWVAGEPPCVALAERRSGKLKARTVQSGCPPPPSPACNQDSISTEDCLT